jgi:hypothetical protein
MLADPYRDELDQILEAGLASYASPQPWPGFSSGQFTDSVKNRQAED